MDSIYSEKTIYRQTRVELAPSSDIAFHRASSVYVLPVHHWHVGCYKDVQENRDMELVSEVRKT